MPHWIVLSARLTATVLTILLMLHVASWSGGKDSTANIILAHENGEPLDVILFSEVMFSRQENISGEDPDHIRFIYNVAKPLFESWGYKVEIVRADVDYLDVFYHKVSRGDGKGKTYGFVLNGLCAVKRDCKLPPINDYLESLGDEEIYSYVGIAVDEPTRLESLHKDSHAISLLEKYNYTEKMAYDLCEKYGLLSPNYFSLGNKRGGCWFCPNAKCREHKKLRAENPELWYRFIALENEPNLWYGKFNCYKPKGELHRREEQFAWEDAQMSLFDLEYGDLFAI